jgi:hypothetical protein
MDDDCTMRWSGILRRLRGRAKARHGTDIHLAFVDTDPRPNHELIYREIKSYAVRQSEQMDSMDGKAGLVAATSTALTGGFLALVNGGGPGTASAPSRALKLTLSHLKVGGYSIGFDQSVSGHTLHFTLYVVAFVAYTLVVLAVYKAARLRDWEVVPNPTVLVDEYWERTANETLADLAATLAKTAADNQIRINDKMQWVGRAYLLLGVEVFILALATLIGAWHDLL